MNRPFLALLAVSFCFVAVLGAFWLPEPPSNQELLANYAKAADYEQIAVAVNGVPWWTSAFLQGCSLAPATLTALTNICLMLGAALAGPYIGTKIAALGFLFLCPLTMFLFVQRLCTTSHWAAFSCGLAYLFAPSILLRLGYVEHVSIVMAFAMIPMSFWSTLVLIEERSLRAGVTAAVGNGLLVLAYAKIAVLILPLLMGFALWSWIARAQFSLPGWRPVFWCAATFTYLAVLPNLPALRELRNVIHFEHGPFQGWQRAFSAQTALGWIDRNSWLSNASHSPQTAVDTPGFYLGAAALLCVMVVLFLRRRPLWQTPEASIFRLFLALALLAQWIGFGMYNPLFGQLAFLSNSFNAQDFAIAISWTLLIVQAMVIYMILPGSIPARKVVAAVVILIYLAVPIFRVIEKLPFYNDIRAPHDFVQVGGCFCFSVAAGLAAWLLVRTLSKRILQIAASILLIGVSAVDAATCVPSFFHSPMDRATFDDFLAAQKFLASDKTPGRVYAYSGRYFYLLTPILSGRGLVTEAFNNYLTLRPVAELARASMPRKETYHAFLDISGVSHLLLDKLDPDTPAELQDVMRSLLPVVFENEHFAILKNDTALAPAAFAKNYINIEEPSDNLPENALRAAGQDLAAITSPREEDKEGLVLWKDSNIRDFSPIAKISPANFVRQNAQRMTITPPGTNGWLLLPEAFHPDWKATQAGRPLELTRSFHGLIGIRVADSKEPVAVNFVVPYWYPLSIWASLSGWIFALGFLGVTRLGFFPATRAERPQPETPTPPALSTTDSLKRSAVLIPTYNEASSITRTLDVTLSSHPTVEILVIDDGSPDGTASLVRNHAAFGTRIHILERSGKQGLGQAYKAGFQWTLEHNFDACLEMDADLSHNPTDIPRLLAALDAGADVAIGSRYLGGIRVINWPPDRLFLSLGATKFVGFVTRLPLTDATSGFKAIRCETLRKLDWKAFKADGYGFQIELHYFLWKLGAKIVEVPIVFTERQEGKTKMTPGIAVEALARVLRLATLRK